MDLFKKSLYNYLTNLLIYNQNRISYFIKNELELQKNDYSKIVLIDKYRNIRGYYNGLDSNNVRLCAEDISYLMVEKNLYHEKNRRR